MAILPFKEIEIHEIWLVAFEVWVYHGVRLTAYALHRVIPLTAFTFAITLHVILRSAGASILQ